MSMRAQGKLVRAVVCLRAAWYVTRRPVAARRGAEEAGQPVRRPWTEPIAPAHGRSPRERAA